MASISGEDLHQNIIPHWISTWALIQMLRMPMLWSSLRKTIHGQSLKWHHLLLALYLLVWWLVFFSSSPSSLWLSAKSEDSLEEEHNIPGANRQLGKHKLLFTSLYILKYLINTSVGNLMPWTTHLQKTTLDFHLMLKVETNLQLNHYQRQLMLCWSVQSVWKLLCLQRRSSSVGKVILSVILAKQIPTWKHVQCAGYH